MTTLPFSMPEGYECIKQLDSGEGEGLFIACHTSSNTLVRMRVHSFGGTSGKTEHRSVREYLRRDVTITGDLVHPGVIQLYDYNETRQQFWVATQPAMIKPLAQSRSAITAAPMDDRLRIVSELLDAIGFIHQQGIIHRNMSGLSVFMDSSLKTYIGEFGLASYLNESPTAHRTGRTTASSMYQAPEVRESTPGPCDVRADVFSAGLLAVEILTGSALPEPLPPDFGRTLSQVLAVGGLRPEVCAALAKVLHKAIRSRPDNRWKTIQELRAAIDSGMRSSSQGMVDSLSSPGTVTDTDTRTIEDTRKITPGEGKPSEAAAQTESPQAPSTRNSHPLWNNRYEIVGKIGGGGQAVVYKAIDHLTSEEIAIKTLLPGHKDDKHAANRLKQEAMVARSLTHRHIIKTYSVEQLTDSSGQEGAVFICMELITSGLSLKDAMDQRKAVGPKFSVEEVLHITRQLLDALKYAHEFTVHRDVKPSNIMLVPQKGAENASLADLTDYDIRLMDFGIAKVIIGKKIEVTGKGFWSAHYGAPELADVKAEADARADLYSVGVIVYQMLAGQIPRKGSPALGSVRDDVSARLSEAIEIALNTDRENRYRNASDFIRAIDRATGSLWWLSRKTLLVAISVIIVTGAIAGWWRLQTESVTRTVDQAYSLLNKMPSSEQDAVSLTWDGSSYIYAYRQLESYQKCVAAEPSARGFVEQCSTGFEVKAGGFWDVLEMAFGQLERDKKGLDRIKNHSGLVGEVREMSSSDMKHELLDDISGVSRILTQKEVLTSKQIEKAAVLCDDIKSKLDNLVNIKSQDVNEVTGLKKKLDELIDSNAPGAGLFEQDKLKEVFQDAKAKAEGCLTRWDIKGAKPRYELLLNIYSVLMDSDSKTRIAELEPWAIQLFRLSVAKEPGKEPLPDSQKMEQLAGIARYARFRAMFKLMQDMPGGGGWSSDVCEKLNKARLGIIQNRKDCETLLDSARLAFIRHFSDSVEAASADANAIAYFGSTISPETLKHIANLRSRNAATAPSSGDYREYGILLQELKAKSQEWRENASDEVAQSVKKISGADISGEFYGSKQIGELRQDKQEALTDYGPKYNIKGVSPGKAFRDVTKLKSLQSQLEEITARCRQMDEIKGKVDACIDLCDKLVNSQDSKKVLDANNAREDLRDITAKLSASLLDSDDSAFDVEITELDGVLEGISTKLRYNRDTLAKLIAVMESAKPLVEQYGDGILKKQHEGASDRLSQLNDVDNMTDADFRSKTLPEVRLIYLELGKAVSRGRQKLETEKTQMTDTAKEWSDCTVRIRTIIGDDISGITAIKDSSKGIDIPNQFAEYDDSNVLDVSKAVDDYDLQITALSQILTQIKKVSGYLKKAQQEDEAIYRLIREWAVQSLSKRRDAVLAQVNARKSLHNIWHFAGALGTIALTHEQAIKYCSDVNDNIARITGEVSPQKLGNNVTGADGALENLEKLLPQITEASLKTACKNGKDMIMGRIHNGSMFEPVGQNWQRVDMESSTWQPNDVFCLDVAATKPEFGLPRYLIAKTDQSVHLVLVAGDAPFYMAEREITRVQYQRCGGTVREKDKFLAIRVMAKEAKKYADWLGASIPTEKQFLHAAAAGRSGDWIGDDIKAGRAHVRSNKWNIAAKNYNVHRDSQTNRSPRPIGAAKTEAEKNPVNQLDVDDISMPNSQYDNAWPCDTTGQSKPNEWGIYDLVGNVWEWCCTEEGPSEMVICGGSCLASPDFFTADMIVQKFAIDHAEDDVGFRVVVNIKDQN